MTSKKQSAAKKNRFLGLLIFICGLLVAISIVTHSQTNDSTLLINSISKHEITDLFSQNIENKGGVIGLIIAYSLLSIFGNLAFLLPLALWSVALCYTLNRSLLPLMKKIGFAAIFFYFLGLLFSLKSANQPFHSIDPGLGGLSGHYGAKILRVLTGTAISYTIVISILLGGIIWVMPSNMGQRYLKFFGVFIAINNKISGLRLSLARLKLKKHKPATVKIAQEEVPDADKPGLLKRIIRIKKPKKKTYVITKPDLGQSADSQLAEDSVITAEELDEKQPSSAKRKATLKKEAEYEESAAGGYIFPGLDLLNDAPVDETSVSKQELEATAEVLKDTLATFGVRLANGEVEIYPGPIITRYEFKPAPGVKISQIVNLADDLALAMKAKRIRIVAPIPGKSAVGVEIPNRMGRIVYLKEIIGSDLFQKSNNMLPLALGKTISGQPHVVDLASMPHLLIAGATGTGKSVCLNCIITSLLYKKSPEILRFILIDPKMLELSVYNDLPNLEKPVVTEMKYAEKVLAEAVVEMEDRYRRLAKAGVRNIADYNDATEEPIPYVVIIVDELADLMMVGSNRVETLVTRLAQMARAVGIHLILATQRPSVDVITGLIKANFSTRIAFQVATKVDSRTILDMNGAEKLLGRGDMLYMNPAFPEPKRVHGAFISSAETKAICKVLGGLEYAPKRIKNFETDDKSVAQYDPTADAIYKEAVKLVVRHKQGSVSLLQRRLGIGYQRAARLIDQLEESGIVGPYDGSKAREVLVDEQYVLEILHEDVEQ